MSHHLHTWWHLRTTINWNTSDVFNLPSLDDPSIAGLPPWLWRNKMHQMLSWHRSIIRYPRQNSDNKAYCSWLLSYCSSSWSFHISRVRRSSGNTQLRQRLLVRWEKLLPKLLINLRALLQHMWHRRPNINHRTNLNSKQLCSQHRNPHRLRSSNSLHTLLIPWSYCYLANVHSSTGSSWLFECFGWLVCWNEDRVYILL